MALQRIVLVDGSRLLRSMLKRAIERDVQLHIAAEVGEMSKVPSVIEHANVDWIFLLLSPREAVPEIVDGTLRDHPELRLLYMTTDCARVRVRWITTQEISLDHERFEEIMVTLRNAEETANSREESLKIYSTSKGNVRIQN